MDKTKTKVLEQIPLSFDRGMLTYTLTISKVIACVCSTVNNTKAMNERPSCTCTCRLFLSFANVQSYWSHTWCTKAPLLETKLIYSAREHSNNKRTWSKVDTGKSRRKWMSGRTSPMTVCENNCSE